MYSPVLKVHHEVDFEVMQGRYVEKTVTPLETFCHTGSRLRDQHMTINMCKLRGSQPLHLEAFGTLSYFCLPSAFLHPYATCCSKFAVACWRARLCPWHPKKNQLVSWSPVQLINSDLCVCVCVRACVCFCVKKLKLLNWRHKKRSLMEQNDTTSTTGELWANRSACRPTGWLFITIQRIGSGFAPETPSWHRFSSTHFAR